MFILADDMGAWALGCAGNTEIRTPNLDALAARGTRFANFFCASPVCSPARASILTGRIPSAHGVHDWIRGGNTDDPEPVSRPGEMARPAVRYLAGMTAYTDVLAGAGYRCGLVGKWHLGASEQPQHGLTSWFTVPSGHGPYYGGYVCDQGTRRPNDGYLTDVITDEALRFLASSDNRQPFYLSVHYTAPHSPWHRDQHPARYFDGYRDCAFQSCPDRPLHPWQIHSAPLGTGEHRHDVLSGYFAAIEAMDANIGRLLADLDARGLTRDTIVIFTSDNGMNMGHHGIFGKGNGTYPQNMYDTSVKVPFIASLPGRTPAGQVNEDLLSHYDLMPTILEVAGLPGPAEDVPRPGRGFAPLLAGEPLNQDRSVVVGDEYGPVRMIRDRRYKFVHRHGETPDEFYDLEADPDEDRDLIDDPEAAPLVELYRGRLESWFDTYAVPELDGRGLPVTGMGQFDRLSADTAELFATDWRYVNRVDTPR